MTPAAPAPELEQLKNFLHQEHGLDLSAYNENFLKRRIIGRMTIRGADYFPAYLAMLRGEPEECRQLLDSLSVNVTDFFRDDTLSDECLSIALDHILATPGDGPLNSWSAGCATGQEAYTVAMILDSLLRKRASRRSSIVYATDIKQDHLKVAREGLYSSEKVAHVPQDYLRRYFTKEGSSWRVSERLRQSIVFARGDLNGRAPAPMLDLIVCRNVLIYFTVEAKEKVLEILHGALAPHGLLILGNAELIMNDRLFRVVDVKRKLYAKSGDSSRPGRIL